MSRAYIVTRNGGVVTKAPINDNKIPIYVNKSAMEADLANIGENVICMANGFFYLVKTVGGVKTTTQLTDKGYGLPLGTIIAYEGSVPDGFLACDGSAYNTTTYSALYALLGVNTTPNLTSQNMNNTDGWCIKATPAYVEPDTVSDMVNTLRTQDSYSTEEVNTGKKWIDGKPIYRKVYVVNATARTNISTGLPAGSEVLQMWVRGKWDSDTSSGYYTVTDCQDEEHRTAPFYLISEDGTAFLSTSSFGHYVKDITIEYTKATD